MTRNALAELVIAACVQVAKQFPLFDPSGGDVSEVVFRKVARAVQLGREKNLDRDNDGFVSGVARKQARREYMQILKARREWDTLRIDVSGKNLVTFSRTDATLPKNRSLDHQRNPSEIVSRDETARSLRAWTESQQPNDRILIRATQGEISMSEAARLLGVDKSTVSRRRDRLFARARIELAKLAP